MAIASATEATQVSIPGNLAGSELFGPRDHVSEVFEGMLEQDRACCTCLPVTHKSGRTEQLEVGLREWSEPRRPGGLERAENPELSWCRRRIDATNADHNFVGTGCFLKVMNVVAEVPRHEAQMNTAKGRQDAESLRIVRILRIRSEDRRVTG